MHWESNWTGKNESNLIRKGETNQDGKGEQCKNSDADVGVHVTEMTLFQAVS